jgi:hypothetical protein
MCALKKNAMRPVNTMTWRQVGDAKLERILASERRASTLTWGMATDAYTVFHWNPRNGKCVDGLRLDFSQWITKPALIKRCRAYGVLETDSVRGSQDQDVVDIEDRPDAPYA